MDTDAAQQFDSAGDLNELDIKLRQFQLSSKPSNGKLLPSPYLPPELNISETPQNKPPRRAFYGFAVSTDLMLDYALRWYERILTRESLKDVDPFWVTDIWAGAAHQHLELDPVHPRLNVPMVETPDGLQPCVAIYDSYDMIRWNLNEEEETEFLEFIKSELGLPESQEPLWYYCHGR
ncbi:hypothetical protein CONPUDRAFT_165473 [Coniophora puteana RWD-64-598 SS2]|uniref:Uncharacterized protein n=1 Tax=Coniophora puteana (strain RWD-64-598) TaxID=741705 RepID=A0A5M3MQE7_CONPW|nr:uncharacterized protein CONPUDRAFT_165473 [Coniophora puteana RWD-64-598 SS2]EIW81287.1 hypothetical protein CONPUDRAFT_165473 [Coniophora puteana RWD-64-598 SS2]